MDRIAFLLDFIEKNPGDLFSRHALAMEMIKVGNYHEAKLILEQILISNHQYIGSYYHLGKVDEQLGYTQEALGTYQNGIDVASEINDQHALRELKAALNQLRDELED